jgi:hypothetical protein
MDLAEHNHILGLYLIDLSKPIHLAPTINMVEIRKIRENSLPTIPEESTGSTESHGTSYTCTFIDPYGQEFPAFSPGFGGAIFAISNDEPPHNGRPIKRGLLGRKETPIVGLGESTWKMLKTMWLTQARVASVISVVI